MARRDYLFSLAERMEWANIRFILIQIEEAHTDGWPIGRDYQPKNHSCFKDRVDMANQFIQNFNPPFPVYIDDFDNKFENRFRAWPDKFYCIDQEYKVIQKSQYGDSGDMDGVVLEDCTVTIERLLNLE